MLSPTHSFSAAALLAVLACAKVPPAAQPPGGATSDAVPAGAPLAPFAAQRIVVVPTQRLRAGDSLGWAARAGEPASYLGRVDDEIVFTLGERGLGRLWMMPGDVVRALRRNPTFEVDPHALDVDQFLRRPGREEVEVTGAVRAQLRAITALGDARYVLVPTELRFEPAPPAADAGPAAPPDAGAGSAGAGLAGAAPVGATPAGAGRALLRAVIVDTRSAQVVWRGEVASDVVPGPSPRLAASLAMRLADLFVVAPAAP